MWCLCQGGASLEVSDSRAEFEFCEVSGEGMGQREERLKRGARAQTVVAWLF